MGDAAPQLPTLYIPRSGFKRSRKIEQSKGQTYATYLQKKNPPWNSDISSKSPFLLALNMSILMGGGISQVPMPKIGAARVRGMLSHIPDLDIFE